jgi:hypothetical protein
MFLDVMLSVFIQRPTQKVPLACGSMVLFFFMLVIFRPAGEK